MRAGVHRGAGAGPYEPGSLSRVLIELAIATRIPMSEWADAGERAILTAVDVLEQANKAT